MKRRLCCKCVWEIEREEGRKRATMVQTKQTFKLSVQWTSGVCWQLVSAHSIIFLYMALHRGFISEYNIVMGCNDQHCWWHHEIFFGFLCLLFPFITNKVMQSNYRTLYIYTMNKLLIKDKILIQVPGNASSLIWFKMIIVNIYVSFDHNKLDVWSHSFSINFISQFRE